MLSHSATMPRAEFEARTGWTFKPEGACKGDVCLPLPEAPGETVDLAALAHAMNLPLVSEPDHGLWALGPESVGARALTSADAPPLVLPDLNDEPFDLARLAGKKIVVYAWAPY